MDTTELITAILLIAVPIAFNLAFFELGRAFDYPNILRREPDEILRRFHAGGAGLILRWEALLVSALLMLPIAVLLAVVLGASPALTGLSITAGVVAALVQGLGLVRWPFAVPELARRYVAAPEGPDGDATRQSVEVVFATLPSAARGRDRRAPSATCSPACGRCSSRARSCRRRSCPFMLLGIVGLPIGIALLIGTLEFVGPNEPGGLALAGTIVPIAYIAWSVWLMLLGVFLLI